MFTERVQFNTFIQILQGVCVFMKNERKILFEPLKIGSIEIKNKFFMAPMGTLADNDETGSYTNRGAEYYVRRAQGGVGLIITGANWAENDVEPHTKCLFPCPTTMPEKYTKKALEMTDKCHAFGTKIFLQLTAGTGRSSLPGNVEAFVAPSEISNRWDPRIMCRELKTEEVEHIVKEFGKSALIAKQSGFDGIEIHAVHEGYLLDCFTMSLFNKRTDKYGGSLENRLRFATEIVQEIKKTCGEKYPVIIRFSIKSYIKALRQGGLPGEKFEELGRDVDEALEVAKILQDSGYDAFDADAGTYDSWYWAHPPMYFDKGMYLPLAKRLKEVAKIPVLVAGRMDDPDMAVAALNDGTIDGVGLGRPLLVDPEYINKVHEGNDKYIRPCLGCHDGCFGRLLEHGMGSCAVNPECGRETIVNIGKAEEAKKVVVVGGGPAGMEAARVAAMRGHDVTLFEAKSRLGGALLIGGVPDFKKEDLSLVAWYEAELAHLNVKIQLNTTATKDKIDAIHPDVLLTAEGSNPIVPKFTGVETAVLAQDVLSGKVKAKDTVVIIGGGLVGCELALHLAKKGKKVSIVEALPDILKAGAAIPTMNEWMLRDLLTFNNVAICAETRLTAVKEDGAAVTNKDGKEDFIKADQVILAIGYRSKKPVFEDCKFDYAHIYALGDSKQVKNIRNAIWDGYEVARSI